MTHPFRHPMPRHLDHRIRRRLLVSFVRSWLTRPSTMLFGGVVFATALLAFIYIGPHAPTPAPATAVAFAEEVRAVNEAEAARASSAIYHVKRVIREGEDKPAFVASVLGEREPTLPRVDTLETWQHSENAKVTLTSTGLSRPYQIFLSRAERNAVSLYHWGPEVAALPPERTAYDQAHDLGSLYTGFTSTSTPDLPFLPADAELLALPENTGAPARFLVRRDGLEIEYEVDPTTLLITRERIFVLVDGERFEMTVIEYLAREVIPAEEFDEVFTPEPTFERIAAAR